MHLRKHFNILDDLITIGFQTTIHIMQFNARIKNNVLKRCVASAIIAFIVFMVIGRLVSGVHWLTDIIGGILLSAGLVMIYDSLIGGKIYE